MNEKQIIEYPSVQEMDDDQRIGIVKDIFASVTDKYDFLNRFLSLRRDVAWRKRTVSEMKFFNTNRFLDVATGTGDLALNCANTYPDVSVVGVDFVQEMVNNGLKKVESQNLNNRVKLKWGDATNIEYKDNSFDVTAIAFGIRNIPDKQKALSEMKRVIVDDGQVMVLELTTPEPGFWRNTYSFYLNGVLPKLAKWFTKNPAAYEYLADSIMNFPTRKEFVELMESRGLKNCKAIPLTFGVCTLYIGEK
ncbi:MAG: bifunctional demethylmenaquinone methyltransferase/2-methoxy-6-polyprenyl-1,4-benzoquinol methylase UbiE [Candidatus Marinimicrobia bacterium]|jgi:demethylmenaquinone methyltransferase/2-methoxy-6-polyprenyl-1,4-benzoquinol methylase|nr:bifunctional demethylmenaquinone methyltransferase/2-methoxy-6-polyprenyl-1,4-benzoquinol methylase UbiE [Candidatus Neomarinimicrobiota bacterium]MBT3497040.1 bifunctional demethylmenaquinone methyltransferase/2-methoxy-6-polyprenyl-1,4-benzoquinol methylase UbiE [Candidatus Neomarinimicrobiota bacterium]MBT3692493.1 bifunctional demethylmenaquinone methyltransferase/2-methoxy-6-polyprenyl-1,4-benzoquinol methylase UbiE [Candidatus Neomarinimicrobiota bacterium]MBT3731591.1 bifunctional deme